REEAELEMDERVVPVHAGDGDPVALVRDQVVRVGDGLEVVADGVDRRALGALLREGRMREQDAANEKDGAMTKHVYHNTPQRPDWDSLFETNITGPLRLTAVVVCR